MPDLKPVIVYQSKDDSSFIDMIRNEETQSLIFRLWKNKQRKVAELGAREVFRFRSIYRRTKSQLEGEEEIPEFQSYGGKYGCQVEFIQGIGRFSESGKDEWFFNYKGRKIPLNEESIEILFQELPFECPQCYRWLQEKPSNHLRKKKAFYCSYCGWQGEEGAEGLFRAQ